MHLAILSLPTLASLSNSPSSPPHYSLFPSGRRRRRRWVLPALRAHHGEKEEEEKPNFEIDPVKAREALRQLDQELQSLSQNQNPAPPRRRPPTPPIDFYKEESMMDPRISRGEELPEISNSYLAYSAAFLLFITVVYNVFFLLYIKPTVDGRDMELDTLNKEIIQGRAGFQAPLLIPNES